MAAMDAERLAGREDGSEGLLAAHIEKWSRGSGTKRKPQWRTMARATLFKMALSAGAWRAWSRQVSAPRLASRWRSRPSSGRVQGPGLWLTDPLRAASLHLPSRLS